VTIKNVARFVVSMVAGVLVLAAVAAALYFLLVMGMFYRGPAPPR
jgi:hypothetical protein